MRKLILAVAAATVVASAFAAAPLGSTWGVQPLPTDGFHGSLGGGANELVGYQAGPVFSADGTLQASYGLDNGIVVYGSVLGNRSWDALGNTPNDNASRVGNTLNSLYTTLGMQKNLTPNFLVGAQMSYGNYALAPGGNYVSTYVSESAPVSAENLYNLNVTMQQSVDAYIAALGTPDEAAYQAAYQAAMQAYWNGSNATYAWAVEHGMSDREFAQWKEAALSDPNTPNLTASSGSEGHQMQSFKTVGFNFNPYAQYTFGQSTVYGSYTLQELQNAGMQSISTSIGINGSGVGNNFTGGYSYAMNQDLTVGVSGTYQIVSPFYTVASQIRYANSNNYEAATGSQDYISIMPGVNYNISAVQGLSVGLNTGLNWFNFRKCNAPNMEMGNFMSAFVITPSVNYQIPLAQNFIWTSNAQYNGVKLINASVVDTGASMNGQTLNSSFQVTTGLTYNF